MAACSSCKHVGPPSSRSTDAHGIGVSHSLSMYLAFANDVLTRPRQSAVKLEGDRGSYTLHQVVLWTIKLELRLDKRVCRGHVQQR